MAIVEGLQSWNIQITVEVEDEAAANKIFDILQDTLNDNDHTQWNAKMYRDLNMEQALEVFRKNKESILAALPDEVVEAYYPDRVAVGDDTIIDSDMNTWSGNDVDMLPDMFPEKESEEMGTVIQFPQAIESEEKE
tara:strand:+ start:312 stop:719 length:408 start_codon:yes stop_codon:yes gene_type:complete